MHLKAQGLICKEGKNDRLVFDRSFTETPLSACINQFDSTIDEIELHRWLATTRHIVQICNMRMFYPDKETLLFDDDASGVLRHVKLQPQAAEAYAHYVGQTICMTIGQSSVLI